MPNHPWGVASVVSNLIRYSAYPEIRKKVILIGIGSENKPCDKDFGDAEVIGIYRWPWAQLLGFNLKNRDQNFFLSCKIRYNKTA